MQVITLIHDPQVIQRILKHLGLWAPEPVQRGPPEETCRCLINDYAANGS